MHDAVPHNAKALTMSADAGVRWSWRLGVIALVAMAACLPIAWVSIAKALLFVTALFCIVNSFRNTGGVAQGAITPWTSRAVLTLLFIFALSLLWSEADIVSATTAVVRHAKVLTIVLLVLLIRSRAEARLALTLFAGGQALLLLSSWAMVVGLPVPWAMDAATPYIVFSSYLDQGMMFATCAAIAWHLRSDGLWHPALGIGFAILALVNVMFWLEGRSGYLIALAILTLAAVWALPQRLRLVALVATPVVLASLLWAGSQQVQQRATRLIAESTQFAKTGVVADQDSSAFRLNAWYRSIQGIQENPWFGHGVGSWSPTVKRLQGAQADRIFGLSTLSNPHQEFLLWGVELGIAGPLLLLGLMAAIAVDVRHMPQPVQNATLSVLCALLIACLFNSTLFDDLVGDFFCVSLGLLMALGRHGPKATQAPSPEITCDRIVPN